MNRQIGPYEIQRVIGRGGMATVYLAHHDGLDRAVALKKLTLFDDSDPALIQRFLREARLAGSFSHPNIVTVHDYFEHGGAPYIAMEYLARGALRPYVGRLSLPQIGGVLEGLLAGLAHAAERDVVHRDVKPENIMVTDQGRVKIADFGIAKATSSTRTDASLTTTGMTLGTPRYMAPERALGQEVGPESDLYAVGVIAFELLVGQTPFHDSEAPMEILMRQINEAIPPVNSVVSGVDPALSDWVERLLLKDPEARTASAAAAADELDDILTDVLGPRWQRSAAVPAKPGTATVRMAKPAPSTRGLPPVAAPIAPVAAARTIAPATRTRPRRRPRRLAGVALIASAAIALAALAGGLRKASTNGLSQSTAYEEVTPQPSANDQSGAGATSDQSGADGTGNGAGATRDQSGAGTTSDQSGADGTGNGAGATRDQSGAGTTASDQSRADGTTNDARTTANDQPAATATATKREAQSSAVTEAYERAADAARRGDGSDYDDAMAQARAAERASSSGGEPDENEPDENDNGD